MVKRKVLLLQLLVLSLVLNLGCRHQVIHPGAINSFDSSAADALSIYQADLDQAKLNISQHTWPVAWVGFVDGAGQAYNTAFASYQTWRDTRLGLKQGDPEVLQRIFEADLNNLADQITSLFKRAGQKVPQVPK